MRVDDATLCGGWKDLGNPLASIFTDALIIPAPFSPVRSAVCTAFSSCLPAFPKEGDDRMGTLSAPVAQLLERVATQSGRNPEVGFAVTGENPARSTIRESRGMEPCFVAPCREGVPNPDFLDTPQRPLDRATSQEAPNALAAPDGDNGRRLPGSFIKKPRNGALTAVRKSGQAPRFFVLSTPQCSSGVTQSRPFPARAVKIMESAGQCARLRAPAKELESVKPRTTAGSSAHLSPSFLTLALFSPSSTELGTLRWATSGSYEGISLSP